MLLKGKVALVAGATRGGGRGIAVELGAAGATVYATGRTTRTEQSEYHRPETIEETAELVTAAKASRSRSIISTQPRSSGSSSASAMNRRGSTFSSTTSGAARTSSNGTSRSGTTISKTA